MGAAIAFYTIFSLAPLLLIAIAVAGLIFGEEAARGAVVQQLGGMVGETGAQGVQSVLEAARDPERGVVGTIAGVITLAVGATTVFAELQTDLDVVWKVPPDEQSAGLWGFIRTRLLSFGIVLGVGFLLIVSLLASTALAALGEWWGGWFGEAEAMLQVVNALVSFAVITTLFAMIFKMLPGVKIAWSDVWIGAAVTSLLFTIGKTLIGLYIGKTALASSFGAAGTFVVVIVWVYYSSLVFLLGAEFTHSYARSHGSLYRAANAESPAKGRAPGERADIPRARPAATGQPRAATRRRG
jgi:membrane protein